MMREVWIWMNGLSLQDIILIDCGLLLVCVAIAICVSFFALEPGK